MPFVQARIAIPSDKPSLDAALEGLTRLNVQILKTAKAAGRPVPAMYAAGVRWQPDSEKGRPSETWDTIDVVRRRGFGDCEDLAAWRAAELRFSGRDSGARAVVRRSNSPGVAWHCIVQLSNGKTLDPSIKLGMLDWHKRNRLVRPPPARGMAGDGAILGADFIKALRAVSQQLTAFTNRFAK